MLSSVTEEDLYEKILRVENFSQFNNSFNYTKISNITDNFMINDINTYLPKNILYKVDRLSMLNSLETRAPYLDKELFKYVWSVPQKIKFYEKKSKYILKKILTKYLPLEIINKPKIGFDIPLYEWIKTNKILEEIIKEFYYSKNEKIKELKLENKNKLNEINKSNYAQIWKISMINKWIIENY